MRTKQSFPDVTNLYNLSTNEVTQAPLVQGCCDYALIYWGVSYTHRGSYMAAPAGYAAWAKGAQTRTNLRFTRIHSLRINCFGLTYLFARACSTETQCSSR